MNKFFLGYIIFVAIWFLIVCYELICLLIIKLKKHKLIMHTDRAVLLDKFPNKLFDKHWDDAKKDSYIIVENKKYYFNDMIRRRKNDKKIGR